MHTQAHILFSYSRLKSFSIEHFGKIEKIRESELNQKSPQIHSLFLEKNGRSTNWHRNRTPFHLKTTWQRKQNIYSKRHVSSHLWITKQHNYKTYVYPSITKQHITHTNARSKIISPQLAIHGSPKSLLPRQTRQEPLLGSALHHDLTETPDCAIGLRQLKEVALPAPDDSTVDHNMHWHT